jgi:hypothetical protein
MIDFLIEVIEIREFGEIREFFRVFFGGLLEVLEGTWNFSLI